MVPRKAKLLDEMHVAFRAAQYFPEREWNDWMSVVRLFFPHNSLQPEWIPDVETKAFPHSFACDVLANGYDVSALTAVAD
jgi:hypothetical protein